MTQRPDLSLLEDVVSSKILDAMRTASEQLARLGIRHALVGALAVGANGYPRATKDVDFLVGEEAFQHLGGGIVAIAPGVPIAIGNVPVDPISIAPGEEHLHQALSSPRISGGIPIAPVEALVYLKLKSPRRKDAADIVELVRSGIDPKSIRDYLARHAPGDLERKFQALVAESEEEA